MNDLWAAVARNDSKEAIRLLETGFDPDTEDQDGCTALMHAVIDGKAKNKFEPSTRKRPLTQEV